MKVIHLETKIQAVFGILDDDGNVVKRHPVVLDAPNHTESVFSEAGSVLRDAKQKLVEQIESEPKDEDTTVDVEI